nr:leucine-rich repeat extensin-like protein 3 [Ipomoea trifida]
MKQNSDNKPLFLISIFLIIIIILFNVTESTESTEFQQRELLSYGGDALAIDPTFEFPNPRLKNAYIALQAWKEAIISDPNKITENWVGSDVCNYTGVFCWWAPDDPSELTVAGIDINHADVAGTLPHELGLLYDISLFHINSNRFCGTLPRSFSNLKLLFELDLSNNRFAGKFPSPVLQLSDLKYLDLRFNEFEGGIPAELFEMELDAIFVNNNRFSSELPGNLGNSKVSVIVLANNQFRGCLPRSLGKMSGTLNELVLSNNAFRSCLPSEIGELRNLSVLDVSRNKMVGELPAESIGRMMGLKELNLGHNMFSGEVSDKICSLDSLLSFDYEYNFFTKDDSTCLNLAAFDDTKNCLRDREDQRSELECNLDDLESMKGIGDFE